MVYLESFKLLTDREEGIIMEKDPRNIYNNSYPLHIFPNKFVPDIQFSDITIFYGNNGSGKTTLLDIIAKKLNANSKDINDKGSYFKYYVDMCKYKMDLTPVEIKKISSDDIFDNLLNLHAINSNVNRQKEILSKEFLNNRQTPFKGAFESMELLKDISDSKRLTMSSYVRQKLANNNLVTQSNGETALMFWQQEISENAIYILDEPENSLSAENQIKLKQFILESARFYNCQFIISTHSPFLLSLKSATIYDIDSIPAQSKKWYELENIKLYYNFFKEYENEFKEEK